MKYNSVKNQEIKRQFVNREVFYCVEYEDYPAKDETVPYLFGTADRYHIAKGITDMVNCVPRINRSDLILYYNGKTLRNIDYDQAYKLAWEYRRGIEGSFK